MCSSDLLKTVVEHNLSRRSAATKGPCAARSSGSCWVPRYSCRTEWLAAQGGRNRVLTVRVRERAPREREPSPQKRIFELVISIALPVASSTSSMEPSNKPTGPHELELTPSAPPSPSATTSTSNSIRSPSPTLPTSDRKPSSRRGPASFPADPRPWPTRSWAYQYRPFRGMWADVKRRLPYYCSDWTEAVLPKNMQRTVGTTIRIYFLK